MCEKSIIKVIWIRIPIRVELLQNKNYQVYSFAFSQKGKQGAHEIHSISFHTLSIITKIRQVSSYLLSRSITDSNLNKCFLWNTKCISKTDSVVSWNETKYRFLKTCAGKSISIVKQKAYFTFYFLCHTFFSFRFVYIFILNNIFSVWCFARFVSFSLSLSIKLENLRGERLSEWKSACRKWIWSQFQPVVVVLHLTW